MRTLVVKMSDIHRGRLPEVPVGWNALRGSSWTSLFLLISSNLNNSGGDVYRRGRAFPAP